MITMLDDIRLDGFMDALIPIVAVIIWIISAMVKGARNAPSQDRLPESREGDTETTQDPEQQLRRFLDQLSGEQGTPPAIKVVEQEEETPYEPPPPPPRAEPASVTPRRQPQPEPIPFDQTPPPAAARPEVAVPRQPTKTPAVAAISRETVVPSNRQRAAGVISTAKLLQIFQDPKDVQRAIIIREVLGPPIGMQ